MSFEAGIGALRAHFIRETTYAVTPTNPDWLLFSDELDQIGGWAPNTNIAIRKAIGTPDTVGFSLASEDHMMPVNYRLQRWLATTGDPSYDGFIRDANGYIPSSHSVIVRQKISDEGTDGAGSDLWMYTYGYGGKFETIRISGDPGTGEPVLIEGTYRFQKARSYAVSQPSASDTITVQSTSTADTTQTLTVENEGAGTSEGISLNGTTPVASIASFASIDAFWLDAECVGDVTIERTTGGAILTTIYGSASQQNTEGDRGIPLLGTGSFEASIGTAFEHILGDAITKGGSDLDANISSFSIEVNNGISADPVTRTKGKVINEGYRDISVNATVFSARGSHDSFVEHLLATQGNIVWTLDGGTITVSGAVLTQPGERTYTKGEAIMRRDNVFSGTSVSIA